jgi:hypothetical protein
MVPPMRISPLSALRAVSLFGSLSCVISCAGAPQGAPQARVDAAASSGAALREAPPERARAVHALSLAMADRWADALGAARAAITKDASPASRGAVQMALSEASGAALAIGSDADAGAAALDLLVQSSLQNWLFTANPRGAGVDRAEAERALAALAPARTDLWSMASREFDAQTLADLRILVDAWVKARGDDARVSHVRLADLASPAGGLGAAERERAAAILAAASARARGVDAGALLGERMLWYLSRYPALLGTQAEATAARIADAAERSGRSDRAAFADTLAKERVAFGEVLADERKALAAAATTERKAIAGSLGEERAALADALAKERAALADALVKHREASFADLAREREALVAGVKDAVASSGATAASEREAFAKWAAEERAAFADDLEARLVKLVDRALVGAGIVAGALLVGLAILKFIPSRKAG